MEKRFWYSVLAFIGILAVTILVVVYARGYRPDLKGKSLKSTGLLVATSTPNGASVYVNGKLKTATNNTVSLTPGWYEVKIAKEGYIPWEKKLRVQGEIVTKTEAVLFPAAPAFRPLTTTGAINPTLSPNGLKLAYGVASGSAKKQGVWIYELSDRPALLTSSAKQIGQDSELNKFSKARFIWSYDSKQLMVLFLEEDSTVENVNRVYLLEAGGFNEVPEDITLTYVEILKTWGEEKKQEEKKRLLSLKKNLLDQATKSAQIISWSPDEDMFLYRAKKDYELPQIIKPALIGRNSTEETRNIEKGKLYVYDIKEDKNYLIKQGLGTAIEEWIGEDENILEEPIVETTKAGLGIEEEKGINLSDFFKPQPSIFWYPDSRHLVVVGKKSISIIEFDNTNAAAVYEGPFEDNFVFSWPAGRKLVILTSYNKAAGFEPNLYAIDLK